MMTRLVIGLSMIGVAGVAGMASDHDKAKNYHEVEAKVTQIDRECTIINSYEGEGGSSWETKGSCITVDGWTELKNQKHSARRKVEGHATVTFSYRDQNGSYQTGKLKYDGFDTEFYDLSFGDTLPLLAHNEEPGKLRSL
ncbi:hypothetical protein [Sphingomicrobium sediminis]|uniref:DUF5640 domain-containing protein n=1 Tax=Sphingomicrobium sediminis TaxID=2950949 RepID=A0A9X2EL77_9SPHN|nr:hypothetical protein [Sphingomicrobium sediminis]MCM8557399.1 hypothetical protein [Sphingomicrobium sediminis]